MRTRDDNVMLEPRLFHRVMFLVEIAGAIVGLVMGTASLCRIAGDWAAIGWIISVVLVVRLLSASPPRVDEPSHSLAQRQRRLVLRVLLASVAVFCLTILVTMTVAMMANPAAIGPAEKISIPILALIGTAAAVAVFRAKQVLFDTLNTNEQLAPLTGSTTYQL